MINSELELKLRELNSGVHYTPEEFTNDLMVCMNSWLLQYGGVLPNLNIADIACGNGILLITALEFLISNRFAEQYKVLDMLHGCELYEEAAIEAYDNLISMAPEIWKRYYSGPPPKHGFGEPFIIVGDALEYDWSDIDWFIMNPPYIGGSKMRATLGDEYAKKFKKIMPKGYPLTLDYSAAFLTTAITSEPDFIWALTTNSLSTTNTTQKLKQYLNYINHAMCVTNWPWSGDASVHVMRWDIHGILELPIDNRNVVYYEKTKTKN